MTARHSDTGMWLMEYLPKRLHATPEALTDARVVVRFRRVAAIIATCVGCYATIGLLGWEFKLHVRWFHPFEFELDHISPVVAFGMLMGVVGLRLVAANTILNATQKSLTLATGVIAAALGIATTANVARDTDLAFATVRERLLLTSLAGSAALALFGLALVLIAATRGAINQFVVQVITMLLLVIGGLGAIQFLAAGSGGGHQRWV